MEHSLFISLLASLAPSTLLCSLSLEPGPLLGPKLTCLSFTTEKESLPLITVSIPKLPGQDSDWSNLSHMVTAGLEGAGCPDHVVGAGCPGVRSRRALCEKQPEGSLPSSKNTSAVGGME